MPYRRRYARSRRNVRRYRKKYRNSRSYVYGKAGRQLWNDVQKLKGLINVEFKYSDLDGILTPGNPGTFVCLNALAKGDDATNRDGRQVRFKSSLMRIRANINSSATHTTIRYLLFIDKQPNATNPLVDSLLEDGTNTPIISPRAMEGRKRFVILLDRTINVSITSMQERYRTHYLPLDMKTIYDDSDAGTIADISTNALWLYVCSDEITNTPSFQYWHRVRFIDN